MQLEIFKGAIIKLVALLELIFYLHFHIKFFATCAWVFDRLKAGLLTGKV